jgi:imidazolonepropionase-like amidohydrolase
VVIAAGSDAGNIGTLHGPSLHRELELMVQAGLSPSQVLVAATRGGAMVMGREEQLGTLEASWWTSSSWTRILSNASRTPGRSPAS